ncbi:hypothetical protein PAXRUDRAFT_831585 [Paxillus rubicundulus Ve08.2h10]|uniref:Unplaced genomic scaffold scaffold_675, whole genome shotgun sequence n=1 Tax=Paxillus rubicundulus Ve08.2h10 TaxID=930991 RepID=A0A0D0DWQ7_9AGAM|nr:hypothetical protein PAXRUDRAFT_831585 [Paxillus rubicundulus Ve08.2h10]
MSQNMAYYNDGYNHDFTDEDAMRLVRIAASPEYRPHTCRWIDSGTACDGVIQGLYFPTHMRECHSIFVVGQDSPRFQCQWEGCSDTTLASKDILMRHIQERHLLWRWNCPNCGMVFLGKVSRNAHHALCGVSNK